MQTITIAQIIQHQVNPVRFTTHIRRVTWRRRSNEDDGQAETLDVPYVEQIQSNNRRLAGMATAVVRSRKRESVNEPTFRDGYMRRVERQEEVQNYARIWVGHRGYGLFCFMTGSPGGTYPAHRLMLAQSLTQDRLDEEQGLVIPLQYDLSCVRQRFGVNIWDQNFLRDDAIRRGRIRGTAMQRDPLYREFQQIGTYIGVEIAITGSHEMVKVFSNGRLQFMSLQPEMLENPVSREASLDIVVQVIDRLRPCEA